MLQTENPCKEREASFSVRALLGEIRELVKKGFVLVF
jgi:hypothetical protein